MLSQTCPSTRLICVTDTFAVAASCNSKKGSKSLQQLGWKLRQTPKVNTVRLCTIALHLKGPFASCYTTPHGAQPPGGGSG